jgi:DnaJ-class molecular chaperone
MQTIKGKNFYEVFGLSEEASSEEIKQVYRQLAQIYHPDSPFHDDIVSTQIEEKELDDFFKELTAAYNVLIDPRQRKEYDAELRGQKKASGKADPAPPPSKFEKGEQISARYRARASSVDRYQAYKAFLTLMKSQRGWRAAFKRWFSSDYKEQEMRVRNCRKGGVESVEEEEEMEDLEENKAD